MKITGTFIDEISHDIPHQNWGEKEWDADFSAMQSVGIDTVILIRCGYQRWMTFPSEILSIQENCFLPQLDLVDLFLNLAEKYGMAFFFGTYDSGKYWKGSEFQKEIDLNLAVTEEVWRRYGHHPAFKGWYLSQEVSRRTQGIAETYARLGMHCKALSNDLPVLISPWIDGVKSVEAYSPHLQKRFGISLEQHRREWGEIMESMKDGVDIVAFQDGHVDWAELPDFLAGNKALADEHGLISWTNSESFDRDMPIKFLPIKWEKLLHKLKAAEQVGMKKAITFEFSHFMSPNSSYPQARHLFNRYCEYFGQGFD